MGTLVSFMFVILFATTTFAAKKTSPKWQDADFPEFKAADWKKPAQDANAAGKARAPASPEYDGLVTKLLEAKDSASLQAEIDKAKKDLPTMKDPSARFLAHHLVLLETVRGGLWRMRPVIEKNLNQNRFAHSIIVSLIKQSVAASELFNPSQPSAAVRDYLASPYAVDGVLVGTMSEITELQAWLHGVARVKIKDTIKALQALVNEGADVRWNSQLTFGAKSFPDGIGRDVLLGPEEINAMIAAYELNVAQINVFCAYHQEGVLELVKETGMLYGFDGWLLTVVDGVTAAEVEKVLRDPKHKNLWTLIKENGFGEKAMAESLRLTRSAVSRLTKSWERIKARPNGSPYTIPMKLVHIDLDRSDSYVENLNKIVNGQQVRSAVTGEVAKIDFDKLFSPPPEDLKALYPSDFDKRRVLDVKLKLKGGGESRFPYRNYAHGTPTAWKLKEYQKFAPVSSDADVARTLRVLSHTVGGSAVR